MRLNYIPRRNIPEFEVVNYGYLYNWYAATDSRNLSNSGWRVPDHNDFDLLATYLSPDAGHKLREISGWAYDQGATNEAGFNGKPGGYRLFSGQFVEAGYAGTFLCTDTYLPTNQYVYWLESEYEEIANNGGEFNDGNSVRLLKDSTTLSHGQTGTYTGNDGKVYPTICIGTQEWLADNLKETKYRDGSLIPEITDNTEWAALTTGARCSYNNNEANA